MLLGVLWKPTLRHRAAEAGTLLSAGCLVLLGWVRNAGANNFASFLKPITVEAAAVEPVAEQQPKKPRKRRKRKTKPILVVAWTCSVERKGATIDFFKHS